MRYNSGYQEHYEPWMETPSRRDSGIPLLGEIEWGANICLFYLTNKDLLDSTAAFLKAGLLRNELCIWAVSDPVTTGDAKEVLSRGIEGLDAYIAKGDIEISSGVEWTLSEDEFNLQRIAGGWSTRLADALRRGYQGLRVSGNASWLETGHWKDFCDYDQELDRCVAGKKIILLCTHAISAKRVLDLQDVVRAHHFTLYRRHDKWDFADTAEFITAVDQTFEFRKAPQSPFSGEDELTVREKVVLAHIVQGHSSKEIGQRLAISVRTIDFHRANIMAKTGARNVADLLRIVLAPVTPP